MKIFDLGELRRSAKLQQTSRSKSISDISKSPQRGSESFIAESYYLCRWGSNLENKVSKEKNQPWVNVGQGIYSIAVGEKHAIILNNKNECYGCGNNQYGQIAVDQSHTNRPIQISSLKDMKIAAVFCGSYHSFVQNTKGQIYAFGLNLKGQLGIGSYEDEKKPILVYSLLPDGSKNPKAHAYIETNEYQKKIKSDRKEPLADISSLENLVQQLQHKSTELLFHLSADQAIVQIACGPLHSIALSTKGRIFSCGYGEHYSLGTGDRATYNQFKQIKTKVSGKIDKIETGLTSFVLLASGKIYVCGKMGQQVYESISPVNFQEEIKDIKCAQNSCVILTKKGDLYQFGEYFKESGDQYYSEMPRKIERLSSIISIFSGLCGYYAIGQSKTVWSWGENSSSQISGCKSQNYIYTPTLVKIPINLAQHARLIVGSTTTYLLSSKPLDVDYERYDSVLKEICSGGSDGLKKSISKKKSFIKTNESNCIFTSDNIMDQNGVEPRSFNQNFQIDFNELVFDKQISEGGYGIIYKGKWRETTVAIKLFKIESEGAVRDFFSEYAAMEALRHPNIVMFLGACTKSPNLAIVLEYCCRGSLWSTIQNLDIQLSWQDRRRFALDTAKGVHYLHSCHPPIIHRDLKSLNLLLDDSYRVKLADFGWTKGLDKYMTGKIGTYQWMAPEVIGSEQYSEKADVFSFGIILWEIASRQPPYRSIMNYNVDLTGLEVSIEVVNNDLRPNIPKKTPETFARLMKKCWDKQPFKRPSFKQIIKQLETMKL